MMNAINAVRKKLTGCPSCVSDPDLRKKLLGYLGGDNDGSGQTFIFTKEKIPGCMVTRGISKKTWVADWKQKGCECLPAKIIHELVHDTWQNIINFVTPEKWPESIEDACYPHPFGDGCKF